MTYKNIFYSLMMLTTLTLAVWMTILSLTQQSPIVQHDSSLPDALMENVTSIEMDKEGKPKMQIVTPKIIHFAENDTTHILSPILTVYRQSPIPWYVTSKFAKTTHGTENVEFWDDVFISHSGDKNNPATSIKTSTLTVYPANHIAETNDAITLTQPNLTMNAIGMHADMDSGDIKLLFQARGEYVPNS